MVFKGEVWKAAGERAQERGGRARSAVLISSPYPPQH